MIRIEFRQAAGAPLRIAPKSSPPPGRQRADERAFHFGNRRHAGVDRWGFLISHCLEAPPTGGWRRTMPVFVLKRCRIQGSASDRGIRGLIHWTRTDNAAAIAAEHAPFGYIVDSYLIAPETVLQADIRRRGLVCSKQSACLARRSVRAEHRRSGILRFPQRFCCATSPFSAANNFFRIESESLPGPVRTPLAIFADQCLFGPPIAKPAKSSFPAVMTVAGPAIGSKQVVWFGHSNGYAPEIGSYQRPDGNVLPDQKPTFRTALAKRVG